MEPEHPPASPKGLPMVPRRMPGKRWAIPAGLLLAAICLQCLARLSPDLTENLYSRSVYPHVARALSAINRGVPFSAGEALLIDGTCSLVAALLFRIARLYRKEMKWRAFLSSTACFVLWLTGIGLLLFMLLFGLNYQRQTLSHTLGYEGYVASPVEIESISGLIIDRINDSYAEAHAAGVSGGAGFHYPGRAAIVKSIEESYRREEGLIGASSNGLGPPKPVYFSHAMTRLGLGGVFMPYTGEPNYNAEIPEFDLPFDMAHEMAHQRGFAREDEANFIAFLVCTHASEPFVRYSGYLNGLRVMVALFRVSPERHRELYKTLDSGPRSDLRARSEFWARSEGRTQVLSNKINNLYLKANLIRTGVRSYNDVVSLIIGYYLKTIRENQVAEL